MKTSENFSLYFEAATSLKKLFLLILLLCFYKLRAIESKKAENKNVSFKKKQKKIQNKKETSNIKCNKIR